MKRPLDSLFIYMILREKSTLLLIIFWALLITASCARRGAPTGGPKDSIPPTLVKMNPALGRVNFKGDELELQFSELIEARDLKKELIINPNVKDYKFYVSKRSLFITLDEALRDSTTYTFNFREGIKDITERNPAENVVMAFSTGAFLDSFQVIGNVKQLLTGKPAEDVVVGLYATTDTLDIFNSSPMYLTKTDQEGNYLINYIREGNYKIYAFNDQNNNLKYESNTEALGFKAQPVALLPDSVTERMEVDSLTLADSTSQALFYGKKTNLHLVKKDIRPLRVQSSRPNGKYYEIKFNKPLQSFTVRSEASDFSEATKSYVEDSLKVTVKDSLPKYLFSNFQEQQQTVRIYNTLRQDSLKIYLTAQDSVGQQISDSVFYIKFSDTRRKAEELTQQTQTRQPEITQTIEAEVMFNKPIVQINTDSILLVYDTLATIPIRYDTALQWNSHNDVLTFYKKINKQELLSEIIASKIRNDSTAFELRQSREQQYIDSLKASQRIEKQLQYLTAIVDIQNSPGKEKLLDSIRTIENEEAQRRLINRLADTISVTQSYQRSYNREEVMASMGPLTLYMAPGSFISVEGDSSKEVRQNYGFKKQENYGTIKGKIDTEYPSFVVQLLDKNYTVMAESNRRNSYSFALIQPGEYMLRILIDSDEDGQWEEGSILQNQEPEPVIFFEQKNIALKANWEITQDLAF